MHREKKAFFGILFLCPLLAYADPPVAKPHVEGAPSTHPQKTAARAEQTLPRSEQRGAGIWPKLFYQEYSRSQQDGIQDARFTAGFEIQPVEKDHKRCLQVVFKLKAQLTSRMKYYRDRFEHASLFNAQNELPGKGAPAGIMTEEKRKQRKRLKDISLKSRWFQRHLLPVYISIGRQDADGELVVGCVSGAGDYKGVIELKSSENASEKTTIPWSFTFKGGNVESVTFGMSERAVPDSESWMGEIHPRSELKEGEHLRDMSYRFVGSTTYAGGEPENYYETPYRIDTGDDKASSGI